MAIVQLDHALGFDEEGRARTRRVVHDPTDLTLGVGLDRQHEAIVADRVVGVREMRGDRGVLQALLDATLEIAAQPVHVPPRFGEGRGRGVQDLAVGVERARDLGFYVLRLRDLHREVAERGRLVATPIEEPPRGVHRLERAAHVDQLRPFEHAPLLGTPERGAQVDRAGDRGHRVDVEQRARLRGFGVARADAARGRFEERVRRRFREHESADRRAATHAQAIGDSRPFEALERRFGDLEGSF